MKYKPGLHIVCELQAYKNTRYTEPDDWKLFMQQLISEHGVHQVGEVFHVFEGGGYTAVHCLTESHIAVHTWPEYGLVTFDVFLCNYQRDNSELTEKIATAIKTFFGGKVLQENKITR